MEIREEVKNLLISFSPEKEIPQGANKVEIEKLSEYLAFSIPGELVDWLSFCNAPFVGGGAIFLGVPPAPKSRLIKLACQSYPFWVKNKWIPISEDGFGNYYALDVNGNSLGTRPVYFIDHEESYDKPCYIAASGLWVFIRFILEKEKTKDKRFPFDKNYVLEKDPLLKAYEGIIPLPWQA